MKPKYIFISLFSVFLLSQCARQKKIVYNIPANYPEDKKKTLLATLDKGKKLYKTNCSKCHGIFTKGTDGIPNFSDQQIDNYSGAFMRRDRKNHALAMQMSPEQLNEVLTFLRYHKTSGAAPAQLRGGRRPFPTASGR